MRIRDAIVRAVTAPEVRTLSPRDIWEDWSPASTTAGQRVTQLSAMQLTAVYGSVRLISDSVSTLPRDTMIRFDGIPRPYRPRPAWLDYPNPDQTWQEMMGQVMVSQLLAGNAYVLVLWAPDGTVDQLRVVDPQRVSVLRSGGRTRYWVHPELDAPAIEVPPLRGIADVEVLHIAGMMMPGAVVGLSPIMAAAETIGLGLAAQRYGSGFYEGAAVPAGIIEAPPGANLTDTGKKELRESWKSLYSNRRNVAILTEGLTFKTVQIAPEESQFLESRQFSVAEIARIYGAPPHLLADASGSTSWGTGLAEQNQAFVTLTLRPWIERNESRFSQLAQIEVTNTSPRETSKVFVELHEGALLRGAPGERWDIHRQNVNAGLLTADEVRKEEGMQPLPDGIGSVPWLPSYSVVGGTQVEPAPGGTSGD